MASTRPKEYRMNIPDNFMAETRPKEYRMKIPQDFHVCSKGWKLLHVPPVYILLSNPRGPYYVEVPEGVGADITFEALENRRMHIVPQSEKTAIYIEGKPIDFSNPDNASNFDTIVQIRDGKQSMETSFMVMSPQQPLCGISL